MKRRAAEYWYQPSPPLPGLRDLAYAGKIFTRAAEPMAAHRHDCLEICYIQRGSAEWWVGRKAYTISGGQFFFIRPHEIHGGINRIHQPCRYFFIGLHARPNRLLNLPANESRQLLRAIEKLSARSFPATAQAGELFSAVHNAIAQPTELSVTDVRANLLRILLLLISSGRSAIEKRYSNMVAEAIRLMEANIEHPLRLDFLAKRLGWSISHLKTRFRKELGIAPADYYLRLRINRACQQLQNSNDEITSIALRLGFASSQYFATAFKRVIGTTPRQFRLRKQRRFGH